MINDLEIELQKESLRYYENKVEQTKSKLARLQHKDLTPPESKDIGEWLNKKEALFIRPTPCQSKEKGTCQIL